MASSNQLAKLGNDLAIAAKRLNDQCWSNSPVSTPRQSITSIATGSAEQAKHNLLTIAKQLQTLSNEPVDFIQHLSTQNQLLACLKWLGEFQVLACIPLVGSISTSEVAETASVPDNQLCRVVRMTATAGFLYEPQPGLIAHTALSAPFITNLSFLDATMFLAETAAPTSLHMATATQRAGPQGSPSDSAYSIALNTSQSFHSMCVERPRLQRQWSAYRRCVEDMDDRLTEVLGRLNWRRLGSACIVDACAQSTEPALSLAEIYPALHFIVQMNDTEQYQNSNGTLGAGKEADHSGRITVQKRTPAAVQLVKDAAVYILSLTQPSPHLPAQILGELNAHLGVLSANALATLIVAPPLLPEPGTVSVDVEASARLRDLSRLQMTNECALEVDDLIGLVNKVHDSRGRLVMVNKLRSRKGATVALGVKYEAHADVHHIAEPAVI